MSTRTPISKRGGRKHKELPPPSESDEDEETAMIPLAEAPPRLFDDSSAEPTPVKLRAPEPYSWNVNFVHRKHEDVPNPIKYKRLMKHGVRVRDGLPGIFNAVGSKYNRDIVRRNHFMSQPAFDAWNEQRGNKYWAGLQDYDGDGIDTEFVVRRKDAKGDVVAVNGYTTKLSDWDAKRAYYEKFPTRALRSSNLEKNPGYQSYDDFINEKYGVAVDEYGFITHESAKKIQDIVKTSPYNLRIKKPTPYNLFLKKLIFPAFNSAIEGLAEVLGQTEKDLREKCDDAYRKGWVMSETSKFWDRWVKQEVINGLKAAHEYDVYLQTWMEGRLAVDKDYQFTDADTDKFHTWLFNQKEVKTELKELAQPLLLIDSPEYNNAFNWLLDYFTYKVDVALGSSSPSPKSKKYRGQ